jgi:hypothetical protein
VSTTVVSKNYFGVQNTLGIMHVTDLFILIWRNAPLLAFGLLAVHFINNKFGRGLNHIPGPWLAGFSDLWRLVLVWGRRPEVVHRALHAKYGPLVKIGPRTVIVSDPDAIKIIYGLNAGFTKVSDTQVKQVG